MAWEQGYSGLGIRLQWPGNKITVTWEQGYSHLGMRLQWLGNVLCTSASSVAEETIRRKSSRFFMI